ncbi:MAG: protein O-mannosyl-transferase family, partial [Limisphaerales bacterium]
TAEEKPSAPPSTPLVLSPWLVVAAALLFFGLTLNHWLTLSSLPLVSLVTGWDWHPGPLLWRVGPIKPLFLLLTSPVRLLPANWQPLSLNLLSALWAALTLGLLAMSVQLLPHDRTRDQREREPGEFALLSVRAAFLPALFAVLMLAGQTNFWQNAVVASGDMLDLLVFAFLVFCLLRYRIGQNDKWLALLAFVYGLGASDNWALMGFFPLFLIALVWIKGAGFFDGRFMGRMLVCGLAGLLLYLLIPIQGSLGGGGSFWSLLHLELGAQTFGLRIIPRWMVILAGFSTVLPLFFAGVRWPSYEGDISQAGIVLVRMLLRVLHVMFLVLALLVFFDFKYSPGLRMRQTPVAWLSFYYLGALAIGYFSGYVILLLSRESRLGAEKPIAPAKGLAPVILAAVWVISLAAPVWLICLHFPKIQASHGPVLAQFADEILSALPPTGAVILSDDNARLLLVEAACQRRHARGKDIFIETASLPHRDYVQYLTGRYPELQKVFPAAEKLKRVVPDEILMKFVEQISQHQPVYYLHPSFGYFFEVFYLKPHGLIYEMKELPSGASRPPVSSEADIAANQAYWARLEKGPLQTLPDLAVKDGTAQVVAGDYSLALDFWGVELQRANRLKEANASFAEATRMKPDNFIAGLNLEYNNHLQKGDHRPINSTELMHRVLRIYGNLTRALIFNGPIDEPDLELQFGQSLAVNGFIRQATAAFERCGQLVPGNVAAQLDLAKIDVERGLGSKALEVLHSIPASTKSMIDPWEWARLEALAHVASKEYLAAEKILHDALQTNSKDPGRLAVMAEFYRYSGDAALRENNEPEARRCFNNALTNLDLQLDRLSAGNDSPAAEPALLETLMKKAQLQVQLKSYDGAIATMNRFLQLEPSHPSALLIRAVAEVQLKQTQAAKNDYNALRQLIPDQTYLADFGLADVAAAEKDSAAEIRYLRSYLASAPQDNAGYNQVKQRLQKLERH